MEEDLLKKYTIKRQFEQLIYELERIKVFKNCCSDDSKNKSK